MCSSDNWTSTPLLHCTCNSQYHSEYTPAVVHSQCRVGRSAGPGLGWGRSAHRSISLASWSLAVGVSGVDPVWGVCAGHISHTVPLSTYHNVIGAEVAAHRAIFKGHLILRLRANLCDPAQHHTPILLYIHLLPLPNLHPLLLLLHTHTHISYMYNGTSQQWTCAWS